MAKQTVVTTDKPSLIVRIKRYWQETLDELKKVSWPDKAEIKSSTQVVLTLLGVMTVIVFVYDQFFTRFVLLLLKYL